MTTPVGTNTVTSLSTRARQPVYSPFRKPRRAKRTGKRY